MESDRFYSLNHELKSKWNIFMVVVAAALLGDLYAGSPLMTWVASKQVELIGGDPDRLSFITMFGKFNSIEEVGRVFDKALIVIALLFPGIGILKGFVNALQWRDSDEDDDE